MGALLGEPGSGGSFARGPEGYERKALGICIPIYGDSVRQPGVGSSTRNFEIWLKGLWRCGVSLCGSSVNGTWNEDFLLGTLKDM